MNNDFSISSKLISSMFADNHSKDYEHLGIKRNPFPRSGTANINDDDTFVRELTPLEPKNNEIVLNFIANAVQENPINPQDKFQSCVIMGDYGVGKTQLLMYIRSVINLIAINTKISCKPYVIYVDNPGVNLMELIGRIVNQVGEENVRKYLWNDIISQIRANQQWQQKLKPYITGLNILPIDGQNTTNPYNPFESDNMKSYKLFLNAFTRQINQLTTRRKFETDFKEIILDILMQESKDVNVANYFYDFISSDYGVNKAWEGLTNGTLKILANKEAKIIGQIVKLVKKQGYTDFFILVDEFEDITEGRLNKAQLDNYVYNLRTLLDEHREWALFFSMNPVAYAKLRSVSPPLADRISSEIITINGLTKESARTLVKNYLSTVEGNGIKPFTEDGIDTIVARSDGNTRQFLIICYKLVEKISRLDIAEPMINSDFVLQHTEQEEIL